VDRALADDPGGTGIVVADSTSLQFVMTAIDDLDRELGKDVSLIVVSTDRIAVMHEPAVSNISLEPRVVAERAMDTLFSRLGEEAEIPTLARSVELVAPRLTRRATTALFA
jgi:DNA-binding LacI/PurR family transcriptional regulator